MRDNWDTPILKIPMIGSRVGREDMASTEPTDCRKRPSEDTRKDSNRIENQCAPPRRTTTAVDNDYVLSKTVENNGGDGLGRTTEQEITAIPIERVKDALKTLRRFFETTAAAAGTNDDGAFSALSNLEHIVEDRINNVKKNFDHGLL